MEFAIAIFGFIACGCIGIILSIRIFMYTSMIYLFMLIFGQMMYSFIISNNMPLIGWGILTTFCLCSIWGGLNIYVEEKMRLIIDNGLQ